MIKQLQPRALTHHGTVEARALFFDVALIGEGKARHRVLQNWSPGAQVYEVAGGYLLRWDAPRWVACQSAPGSVLTAEKGLLLAAPLTDEEQRALEIISESLVILRGGAAQVFSLAELKPLDVSRWLDVGHFQTVPLHSLGESPAPPQLLVEEKCFDAREKLGVEAAPELEKWLAQMQGTAPEKEPKGPLFARLFAEIAAWWQSLTARKTRASDSVAQSEVVAGKLSFLSVVVALFQIGFIASIALLLMSLPAAKINVSAIFWALAMGVVLYAIIAALWSFLFWIFVQKNALGENNGRWKWLLGGALVVVLFLFFATGSGFDWRAFVGKILTLIFVLFLVLLIGALLVALVIWVARQIETEAKKPKPAASQTASPTFAGDVPMPWLIGGAALGVLIGAMQRGDIIPSIIAAMVLLAAVVYSFVQWKKRPAKSSAPAATVAPKSAAPATSLMPPEPVEGPFAAWRNAFARMIWMAGLWRIYGPIQARYVARLMDMFARGDLDNALRHAIPMGGATTGKAAPFFGLPMPRALLEIFTGRRTGASIMPMPPGIAEQLRQQYRAAFERLEAQGRHEEAAFVLAELLHASAEAVAYLERQNRLRLAAELAESRDLPPDLVVRQWLVAGETERAIWVARRKNAFSAAIVRLEKGSDSDKANAQKLRLLWANELARGGDFVAAVCAAWPVVEARNLVGEWMKRGLLLGGMARARMLAWRCQISTSLEPELREMVLEFLSEPQGADSRLVFAKVLNEGTQTPVTKVLARATARALVRDAASDNFNEVRKAACQKLIEISGDGALRADVPPRLFVSTGKPLKERDQQIEIVIEASDTGALPLYDAAYLPDGRTVAALGEAGARLLARDGRTIAHLDQPCYRLVVSDNGDRALALAPRGQATRIAKLDFATRRAVSWCETRLDACAFSYDGSLWFLACEGSLFAIDTTAPKFGALWHTSEVGKVACIERSPHSCAFITRFITHENFGFRLREKWERWQLEVPSLILRQRTIIPEWSHVVEDNIRHEIFANAVAPDGSWARITGGDEKPVVFTQQNHPPLTVESFSGPAIYPMIQTLQGTAHWWTFLVSEESGLQCVLIDRRAQKERAHFSLHGALYAQVRLGENHFTLFDNRGRLLVFDLERGVLVKDFRLS